MIQSATVSVINATTKSAINDATFTASPAAGGVKGAISQGNGVYVVNWDDSIDVTGVIIISAAGYVNYLQNLLPGWSFTIPMTPSVASPPSPKGPAPSFTYFAVARGAFPNSFNATADVASNTPLIDSYELTIDLGSGPSPPETVSFGWSVSDTVQYSKNGTFKVVFTATDANGTATASASITVNAPPPTVSVSYDIARSQSDAATGAAVVDFAFQTFTAVEQVGGARTIFNASPGIKNFTIDWGDGTQDDMTSVVAPDGNGNYASHTGHWYPASATYVVTATIIDAWGRSAFARTTIAWQYQYQTPAVTFASVATTPSTNGDTVVIQGLVQQLDFWYRVTKLQLDWGDGTVDTLSFAPNPQWESSVSFIGTHIYPEGWAGGLFATATLLVTSAYQVTKAPITFLLPFVIKTTPVPPPLVTPPVYGQTPFQAAKST